ncbi:RNA polymerase sigma-70 factor [Fulvivirga maritima]|uniref:RNA polymerase sigma factor n=1 Tax=Fulvivirga maritima TaxID=2904247 RepID=UPI001F242BF0|nr:RNA polymerase sigma-70 factor [Fulvivirga maritima]UII26529.1 RNA polymerase sigma-70 factor [Fulvivirga maritima]
MVFLETYSEKKLLKSLVKGKESAFKALFDHYHKRVFGLARYMGMSADDAECIVQEVFISIWEGRKKILVNKPFEPYILTITKRIILKKIRRGTLETNYINTLKSQSPAFQHNTEEYIIFKDLLSHANSCIDSLSSSQKQVFMLSKNEGLSNKEIAKKLNISIRTVENQLYRATKEIKQAISDQK